MKSLTPVCLEHRPVLHDSVSSPISCLNNNFNYANTCCNKKKEISEWKGEDC